MQNKSYGRSDGKGRRTKVTLWNRAVDDVAGVVARLALITKNQLFALERVGQVPNPDNSPYLLSSGSEILKVEPSDLQKHKGLKQMPFKFLPALKRTVVRWCN